MLNQLFDLTNDESLRLSRLARTSDDPSYRQILYAKSQAYEEVALLVKKLIEAQKDELEDG